MAKLFAVGPPTLSKVVVWQKLFAVGPPTLSKVRAWQSYSQLDLLLSVKFGHGKAIPGRTSSINNSQFLYQQSTRWGSLSCASHLSQRIVIPWTYII